MAIHKLVCSQCKGNLVWDSNSRLFRCQHCGTEYSSDNEFTYTYVDTAKEKAAEAEVQKEHERQKTERIGNYLLFGLIILLMLVGFIACRPR